MILLYAKICKEYLPIFTKIKVKLNSGNELFKPVSVT